MYAYMRTLYRCVYYTDTGPKCVYYTCKMTMPLVRAASVYTDGYPNYAHASGQTAKLEQERFAWDSMCCTTQRAPASALRLQLFGEFCTPLANLENTPTYAGSLLWLTVHH